MKKKFNLLILVILMFSGCQQFSVLGEFQLTTSNTDSTDTTDALTLDLEKTRALQYEPIELTPSGGTPPYTYSVADNDLYYLDPWNDIGTFSGNSFTPAASVGKVDIILKDSLERAVRKELIIRPPTPTISPSDGDETDDDNVLIEWTISDTDMISSFEISYSIDGSSETSKITDIPATDTSYNHQSLSDGVYSYTISARAQADNYYMSVASETLVVTIDTSP